MEVGSKIGGGGGFDQNQIQRQQVLAQIIRKFEKLGFHCIFTFFVASGGFCLLACWSTMIIMGWCFVMNCGGGCKV